MLSQNHILYDSSSIIEDICRPLFSKFNLNYFRFMRMFPDNSRVILASNPHWSEHFFSNRFYEIAWFDNKSYDFHTAGSTLWKIKASTEDNQIGIDSREQFDMYHGLTVVRRHKRFTEFIDFTAPSGHLNIEYIFNSKMHILNRFMLYFKDKADKIIKEAEKSKIHLPSTFIMQKPKLVCPFEQLEKDFFNETKVNNYYLTDDVKLSSRQVTCIQLMYEGLSIKEIANKLFLAERTVETHIQNAKNTLECHRREDLIRILIEEGVINTNII